LIFIWISLATACHKEPSPDASYGQIRQLMQRGALDDALRQVEQLSHTYSQNPEWSGRFRVLKAQIMVMRGSDGEALLLLKDDPPPNLAKTDVAVRRKMVQGIAYDHLQEFDRAEGSFAEARGLASEYEPGMLGDLELSQGALELDRRNYAAAGAAFHRALVFARDKKMPYVQANALGSLGYLAMWQEHYDEAIDWYRESLELSRTLKTQYSESKTLGNLGWSYFEMGDLETASALYQQAEQSASHAGLAGDRIYWRMSVGRVYLAQHRYDSAESMFNSASDLAKNLADQALVAECAENLALVNLETGKVVSAQKDYDELLLFVTAHPDHYLAAYAPLIEGRIEQARQNYAKAKDLFDSVIKDPKASNPLRWEAEARLASVDVSENHPQEAEKEFRRSIATIAKARSSIDREELRLSFLTSAIAFYEEYIEFLISQGKTEVALQVAEVSRAQTLAEGLGLTSKVPFPIPNFQPRLIAQRFDATLLFYWLGEKRSYLWVITRSGFSLIPLPATSEIEPILKAYRQTLLGPRDVLETSNEDGKKLYEILVAPAQKLIAPGSRVIILPDAGLYGLNFETLLSPKPQLHYWIEDTVVAYANSLVLLAASANQPPARTKKLLLIGNPISPSAEFPDLPQAGTEMVDVERYFAAPDRTVLSRQQATASAYLESKPAQYSFIHFVAHGTASRASPLDSAVILSRQGDSYKLYARDIVTQPLHANLVTISACHGAGERTYSGEGLVGLTWAFLRAGAHGVIAALWEVNDNSTPELMDDLYAEIQKGSAPDAALHHAKLKLLHSGTVYQKPFYWAPFEIYLGH
jgi:CHAT domain-containing protein/Flp pilus assembly protein TadD